LSFISRAEMRSVFAVRFKPLGVHDALQGTFVPNRGNQVTAYLTCLHDGC
jgi:hypothetical protein